MKIGIDISQIAYKGSGIASYTQNLVKSLLKIDKKNQYIFFASALRRRYEIEKFIKLFDVNGNYQFKLYPFPPKMMSYLWNKMHILPMEKFVGNTDVFHTSDWTEPPARALKVTTIHDLLIFSQPQYVNPSIVENQKAKLKWVTKETAIIITDSQSSKNDIIKYLKYPADRIKVVYLGIDKIFYPQSDDAIQKVKNKYKLNFDYLLFLGVNDKRKNWDLLIQAFSQVKTAGLKLVGISSFLSTYKFTDEKIKILQYVDLQDMPALYTGAKAFIYPSLYEGFGLPVLEAMASGVPVITSDRGSLKEIIGENGFVIDPYSTIDLVSTINQVIGLSSEERNNIIYKGIQHTKKFTWEKTASETLKIYESLI